MNNARTAQELAELAEAMDTHAQYPLTNWTGKVQEAAAAAAELRRLAALASQAEPLEWEPLPEDEQERRSFDSSVELYGGDVRTAIATNLRLFAAGNPRGSFGHLCRIMANEVAKLYAPAQAEQSEDTARCTNRTHACGACENRIHACGAGAEQSEDGRRIDAWASNPAWRLNSWAGKWSISTPDSVLTDWLGSPREAIDAAIAAKEQS